MMTINRCSMLLKGMMISMSPCLRGHPGRPIHSIHGRDGKVRMTLMVIPLLTLGVLQVSQATWTGNTGRRRKGHTMTLKGRGRGLWVRGSFDGIDGVGVAIGGHCSHHILGRCLCDSV